MRLWLAMRPMTTAVVVAGNPIPETRVGITLPDGAEALLCAYRTKKAARAWHGKDVPLIEVTLEERRRG